jgi:hypothetical protein
MATYLAEYRMINDYVNVRDGKIINLGFEIDLFVDKAYNSGEIINNTINTVRDYFNVNKWEMGQNVYMAQLIESINNVAGVLNVIDVKVFNKVGGNYSLNRTSQAYISNETKQINLTADFALFNEYDSMFEIKSPQSDIKVRVKS